MSLLAIALQQNGNVHGLRLDLAPDDVTALSKEKGASTLRA